jgi:iron(III) transport system permease protein
VFVITITDFGNAAVIGGNYRVLATEIYSQVSGQMNFGMGSVVGILLLLPSLISVQIERVASQRQFGSASPSGLRVTPQPGAGAATRHSPPACCWPAARSFSRWATVIFASFMRLWPYRMEWTLKHYDITVSGGYAPLWTSLYISLAAASGGVLLLFILSFGVCRIPRAWAKLVYLVSVLPVGVPGLVLGLSYIFAYNVPGTPLYALYGSAALIALCNFYHYHTQGFLTMMTGMRAVPQALEEAVSCLGGGTLRVLRDAGATADRSDRAGRLLLPVHAVHGDPVGRDLPGHAVRERGAGLRPAAGRSGLRLAGRGLFNPYHAGRWRFPAGNARTDRRSGAAPDVD